MPQTRSQWSTTWLARSQARGRRSAAARSPQPRCSRQYGPSSRPEVKPIPGELSIHCAALHAELTDPETTFAAFDDLVATVRDPNNSHLVVQTRLSVFTEILNLADRPVAEICRILGGIVDDQALEISIARHGLDGTPILNVDRPDEQAGLSVDDRLELSRRYLSIPARPGRHIVWVAYGDAHLAGEESRVEVGPVEFFDGPALLEAIAEGAVSPHRLPEELLGPSPPGGRDLDLWPTGGEIRRWVAARVDLGTGQFSDPIRIGRAQADTIVQLAAFENGESTWQPLAGILHIVDRRHHSSERFRLADDFHDLLVDRDTTARAFPEVASTVGARLSVIDPVLGRLLRELSTLNASTRSAEPDMAADIRVIEFVTRQNQSPYWPDFLKDNIAVHHARNRAIREIYQSVLGVLDAMVLDNEGDLERRIREFLPDGRMLMNRKAALDLIPELMVGLPDHHMAARRLREVARRVQDLAQLKAWIDELAADYRIRISRAARFRNGFTHGGAAAPQVATTVRLLINEQARLAAGTALAALVKGQPVKQTFDLYRAGHREWPRQILAAEDIADALFDQDTRGASIS